MTASKHDLFVVWLPSFCAMKFILGRTFFFYVTFDYGLKRKPQAKPLSKIKHIINFI